MNDALLAPRRMLGRYEILGEIAQGAMGVVYKARDPLIDRVVAIKTVQLGLSDAETEAYERRFFREAKSAGRLNHPNVVTIHDVGKTDDIAYIAMEFLDGQSLRELLDSGVVLPPQRIADIAAEVAEGLGFAHDNGVVHRDVKPANIMVLSSGAVKITDFGIALLPTGTRTVAGNAFGSPRYTSPEQVMGRQVDGRSDIFSLGATVYEMLTGHSPFQGGDLNTILKQVLSDPTPPPSAANPRLPKAFDHILGKALAKDPADRYQTAEAMAQDLRSFDAMELGSAGPGPLPALEHPTTPFNVSELVPPPTDEPLAAAASPAEDDEVPLFPPPPAPWWRRPAVAYIGLGLLAVVTVGAWLALRGGSAAPVVARVDAPRTQGTIAAPPPPVVTPPTASAPVMARSAAPAEQGSRPAPSTTVGSGATAAPAPATASAAGASGATPATPAGATTAAAAPGTTVAAPTPAPNAPAATSGTLAEASAPPPAPAPPKATGRVAFAVTPWGEVYVDGRKRGVSPPMQELRLAPGKHVVEIRNTTFEPYRETIEVKADGVVRVKHKFQ